jgi:hypothetical protein
MATTNYSWNLPTVGGSEDTWGTQLNQNWTALDTLLGGTNATEFAILDGATVTTAELNILDGVTASAAEINILDGLTASTAELNLLDGVTWTLADYNSLTASAAELNVLDGISAIASQAEAEAGTAADKLMTPERTKEAIEVLVPGGFGDGQTYSNVTSSRSAGTTYTNSTGKPILVIIRGSTGNNNLGTISATVGAVSISIFAADGSAGAYAAVGSFVVPNGATYSVTFVNCSLSTWYELR